MRAITRSRRVRGGAARPRRLLPAIEERCQSLPRRRMAASGNPAPLLVPPRGAGTQAGGCVALVTTIAVPDPPRDPRRMWASASREGGRQETGEGVAVASGGSAYVTGTTDSFGGFGHLFVL